MSLQLRKVKQKYRFIKYQNKASENAAVTHCGKYERVKKFRKEGGLFNVKLQEYDAEDYYRNRISMRIKDIKDLKKRQSRENCGFGFVAFVSNL